MKLSLCVIAKNEAQSLPVMISSVKDIVDEIIIVDTGSEDNTLEVARQYTDKVYEFIEDEFSFANARNESMKHVTGDWILILDCDESVHPDTAAVLRATLEKQPEHVELVLPNMVMCNNDGSIHQEFLCERIIRNGRGAAFDGAMHNHVNVEVGPKRVAIPSLQLIHNRVVREEKYRAQRANQRAQMAERVFADKDDRRSLFYLAGTRFDCQKYDECVPVFEKYLEISDWPEERYQASLLLAQAYFQLDRPDDARRVLAASLKDDWKRAEAYLMLGDIAAGRGDFREAEWWYKAASLKPLQPSPMFVEPAAHTWLPHTALWNTYRALGNNQLATEHGRLAVELGDPNPGRYSKFAKNYTQYGEERITCLVDRGQMSFIQPLIDHWKQCGRNVGVVSAAEAIDECDIIWCEWAAEECAKLTQGEKKCRIVVRIHGYEVYNGLIGNVNWENVDDVIFVADYLRDLAIQQVPKIAECCNVYVIPGGVEVDKFTVQSVSLPAGRFLTLDDARLDGEQHKNMLTNAQDNEFWSRPFEYQYALDQIDDAEHVLDFGAGNSRFYTLLKPNTRYLTIQDIPGSDLECDDDDINLILGDDLGIEKYDVITSVSVMEHVDDIDDVFKRSFDALKPGGRLVMTFDVPRRSVADIRARLTNAGFVVGPTPDSVPENAIGGRWENGWVADSQNAELHAYALTAYKPPLPALPAPGSSGKRIAMLGFVNDRKNIPLALQILEKCPEHELHIAGEWQSGELVTYVETLADELKVRDRLFIYGKVPDANDFFADKDFILSPSTRETFHYALAEGMAAGLKPVIHCWQSARDFYKDEWIFKTVDEAVEMLQDRGDPAEYRAYAQERLNVTTNIKRIDRVLGRPSVAVSGEPKYPDALENKLLHSLDALGCRTDAPEPSTVIIMGVTPKIEPWMDGKRKILWHVEQIYGDDDHARMRREQVAPVVPHVDLVLTHSPLCVDEFKKMGAKRVEVVECAVKCPPFRPLDVEKKYDVGFSGYINERRKKILEELGKHFNVNVYNDNNHENLNLFYNQCKVVLNLHCTDQPNLETRLGEVAAAGAYCVTERLPDGNGCRGFEDLVSDIQFMLDGKPWAYPYDYSYGTLLQQAERILDLADTVNDENDEEHAAA